MQFLRHPHRQVEEGPRVGGIIYAAGLPPLLDRESFRCDPARRSDLLGDRLLRVEGASALTPVALLEGIGPNGLG